MTFSKYGKANNVTRFSSRKQSKRWERKCEEEKENRNKRPHY